MVSRGMSRRMAVLSGLAALAMGARTGSAHAAAPPAIGELVYLTDRRNQSVTALHMSERTVWKRARLPVRPSHLIANPATGVVAASDPATDRLWLMSGLELDIRREIALDVSPWLIAFSPDGLHLAAGDMSSGLVQIVDPRTGRTRMMADGFTGVHDLRFSADGSALYVSRLDGPRVRRVDLDGGSVSTAFQVDGAAHGIDHMTRTANGGAGIIVTPIQAEQQLAVADLQARRLIRRWSTDRHYWRAYTDPFSRWFLLASDRHTGLDAIDPATGQSIGHVATDMPVQLFTSGFLGTSLIVGERPSGRLAMIAGDDLAVVDTLVLDGPIHSVFMDDGTGQATVVMADGSFETLDVVPRGGRVAFRPIGRAKLDIQPDLSAHANALNFCHS